MKRDKNQSDMLPEYDFKFGVRGKYCGRIGKSPRIFLVPDMPKVGETTMNYYDLADKTIHIFLYKIIDEIKALPLFKDKKSYSTIPSQELENLYEYAQEEKATVVDIGIPPVTYTDYSTLRSKTTVNKVCRGGIWAFKSNGKTIVAGSINIMIKEYDDIYCLSPSFIIGPTKEGVEKFLQDYYRASWERTRKGRCVLNYSGDKMDDFCEAQWDDICLANNLAKTIRSEIEIFFANEKMYQEHGLSWKRGILLAGKPGVGKTFLARAIATTSKVPVIYCTLDKDNMFHILNEINKTIRANAPCVVIFEDADTLATNEALRSAFLNMLDGLFTASGVLTIASTNSPDKLDEAFTGRPSRFDSFYVISDPEPKERIKILTNKLGKQGKNIPINQIKELVGQMRGLSAACVQEVAVCALLESIRKKKPVTIEMLKSALNKVKKHMKTSEVGFDRISRGSIGFSTSSTSKHDDFEEF